MGMNVKTSSGGGDEGEMGPVAEINVTPLVDVMLVLLIIFMITAPLMMSQLPITLPKASLQEMGKPRDPLIVSFDLQGNYYIDTGGGHTEQVTYEELPAKLAAIAAVQADNLVYVRADKGALYGKVVDLLAIVGNSGFYKVSLMSEAQQ
jgi:biopolymer transport protein ExbD